MFYTLLITYILGGITLVPLLLVALIAFVFYTSLPIDHPKPAKASKPTDAPSTTTRAPSLKAWLIVRRTFEPSPSSYINIVRTLLDARSARPRRAEDAHYAVLKGKILYLYEDEVMSECAAAIDIGRCEVSISPDGGLLEGELFAKRNAVVVREKDNNTEDTGLGKQGDDKDAQPQDPHAPWYIFFRSVTDMEDWYLALLAASLSSTTPPEAFAPFPYTAHKSLIDSLDALPDLIPTRWLNALLGRLFLGVKGTKALEAWVVGRLMKKLSKVKTPSWLSAVVVRSFDAGDVAPVLSKPMLKELTPEGEASVGVDVSYIAPPDGGIRITFSATATISLPTTPSLSLLGFKKESKEKEAQKEKPYEVSLVLAVIVRRVEGNVLFKIKRPPSNRLWYAFTTMPHMEVEVTPVVSDRHIRWGMVLSGIEGKLREIIQESVVLPNMDDIPFFDTTAYPLRGGIFSDAFAAPSFAHPSEPHAAAAASTSTAASAPNPDEEPAKIAEEVKPIHRTRSVDVLVDGDGAPDQSPPEADLGVPRAETVSGGSVRKRRTWFGGKKSEESEDSILEGDGEHRRGRSEEGPGVKVLVTRDDENTEQEATARPTLLPRRSQSSRSVSDASTFNRSATPPPDSSTAGLSTAGLSTSAPPSASSPTSSSATSSPASPATSSFLSTLKSRGAGMAEKQPAIKEAMRKWGVGVNWAAGLRKHDRENNTSNTSNSSREGERERERDRELEADYGEVWGDEDGRRSASPRGSYADLRKKVERREKERLQEVGEVETRPIDIPGAEREVRDDAPPLERRASTSRSTASSMRRLSPPGGGPAPFLSPSAPKTTTELHTSPRAASPMPIRSGSSTPPPRPRTPERRGSEQGTPFALDDPPTPTPTPPPPPIRAQPKAATMTIPGIHARHKGEVMGFGSAPPLQPTSSSGSTSSSSSNATATASAPDVQTRAAGKTIQSVYRLLRGGAAGEAGESSSDVREREPRARTASTPTPAVQKSSPPPLPPRAQPMSISPAEPSHAAAPLVESDTTDPPPLLSAASQALKTLSEQDAAARHPPPLPSRRTSQSPAQSRRTSVQTDTASINTLDSEQDTASQGKEEGSITPILRTSEPNENGNWRPPLPPRTNSMKAPETLGVA